MHQLTPNTTARFARRTWLAGLAPLAGLLAGIWHPLAAMADAPGYHIVDRIPMNSGWWDYASFDPVHRRVLIARGDGIFKLDVDSGLMDQRLIPGSEGRSVIVLPGGDMAITTMAGYSVAILFATEAWNQHRR